MRTSLPDADSSAALDLFQACGSPVAFNPVFQPWFVVAGKRRSMADLVGSAATDMGVFDHSEPVVMAAQQITWSAIVGSALSWHLRNNGDGIGHSLDGPALALAVSDGTIDRSAVSTIIGEYLWEHYHCFDLDRTAAHPFRCGHPLLAAAVPLTAGSAVAAGQIVSAGPIWTQLDDTKSSFESSSTSTDWPGPDAARLLDSIDAAQHFIYTAGGCSAGLAADALIELRRHADPLVAGLLSLPEGWPLSQLGRPSWEQPERLSTSPLTAMTNEVRLYRVGDSGGGPVAHRWALQNAAIEGADGDRPRAFVRAVGLSPEELTAAWAFARTRVVQRDSGTAVSKMQFSKMSPWWAQAEPLEALLTGDTMVRNLASEIVLIQVLQGNGGQKYGVTVASISNPDAVHDISVAANELRRRLSAKSGPFHTSQMGDMAARAALAHFDRVVGDQVRPLQVNAGNPAALPRILLHATLEAFRIYADVENTTAEAFRAVSKLSRELRSRIDAATVTDEEVAAA
jgi:hypothetical protein